MAYNYTKASDLVAWCLKQKQMDNKYRLGGIGRYENGVRTFDCIGMIKCFMWHDYSSSNASYYGKTCPDQNCEGMFALAKEKGPIATIPEIPGVIVYQKGHVGVYLGKGEVVECTAAFGGKIVLSYFKGSHTGNKRTTWTHWFKMPGLDYAAAKANNIAVVEYMTINGSKRFLNVYASDTLTKASGHGRYAQLLTIGTDGARNCFEKHTNGVAGGKSYDQKPKGTVLHVRNIKDLSN